MSIGLSSIAELQIDGALLPAPAHHRREPAPLAFKLDIDGDATSDVEDLVIATKLKIVGEHVRRPSIGLRLATKLPNASNETGLGLDTLDFSATVLVGKTRASTRYVGNVGLAILGDPIRGDRQFDVMIYGLSVAHALREGLEVVGEVHGHFQWAWDFPAPGAESKATFRGGVRYTRGAGRVDAGLLVGTTSRDPGSASPSAIPTCWTPSRRPSGTQLPGPAGQVAGRGLPPDPAVGAATPRAEAARENPGFPVGPGLGTLLAPCPAVPGTIPGQELSRMNPIQPGASIQEMARSLMRTVDSNGNGELSTEEFTSFLAKLMTGVQTGLSASPTAVTTTADGGRRRRGRRQPELRGLRLQQGRRPGQVGEVCLRGGGPEGGLDADEQGRRRDLVQHQHQGRDGAAGAPDRLGEGRQVPVHQLAGDVRRRLRPRRRRRAIRRWPGRSSSDRRRPVAAGRRCYTLRPAMADAIEILKAHAYGNDFLYASAEAVAATASTRRRSPAPPAPATPASAPTG